MKTKISITLLAVALFAAIIATSSLKTNAQEIVKPKEIKELKSVFKCNPFYTFGGWVPITYEGFISPNKSIMLSVSYITNPMNWVLPILGNSYPFETRSGFYINPSMRFYLYKIPNIPAGFYASPEFGFIQQTRSLTADTVYQNSNNYLYSIDTLRFPAQTSTLREYQVAATVGWQGVINRVFVWDVYIGEGFSIVQSSGDDIDSFYKHINAVNPGNQKRTPKDGARLLAGFRIGIPF